MRQEHHHHHAFSDPEELAKKWNTPERDQWQRPEKIIEALALEPGATVADIGAGTGYMVAHLSRAVGNDGTVIAIDAEAAMVAYLTKYRDQLGPASVVPRQVGLNDPELPPSSVDGVLILDLWHHLSSQEAYAKKVFDSLKPGGRFVVVDYRLDVEVGPPTEMRIAPAQVVQQLEAAGFQIEAVEDALPRHYLVAGRKD